MVNYVTRPPYRLSHSQWVSLLGRVLLLVGQARTFQPVNGGYVVRALSPRETTTVNRLSRRLQAGFPLGAAAYERVIASSTRATTVGVMGRVCVLAGRRNPGPVLAREKAELQRHLAMYVATGVPGAAEVMRAVQGE